MTRQPARLTVDAFAELDDFAQLHGFVLLRRKMGQDTRAECDVFVEVALSEAIAGELELGRLDVREVCVENTKGIEFRDVVAANLVGPDEELDLQVVVELLAGTDVEGRCAV